MKILLAYATKSGSTVEVAEAIQRELCKLGAEVEMKRVQDVTDIAGYDGVVVGAPMIVGWHRGAMKFLRTHQATLSRVPVALFVTCASLTDDGGLHVVDGVPVTVDPNVAKPPKNPNRISREEKFTLIPTYVEPILKQGVKPMTIALFAGKIDYHKLDPLAWLFVKFVIRAKAGDRRNWDLIQRWAFTVSDIMTK